MTKRLNSLKTLFFMLTLMLAVSAALNTVYLYQINNSIKVLSEQTLKASDNRKRVISRLKYEKERMAFMTHVVDIKSILDAQGSKTGSYSTMDFAYLIARESFENNLDPLLVLAVIKTESSFRKSVVSHKGAIGLMQILPNTAHYVSDMHEHIELSNSHELFEPNKNILIGINYLSYLINKFENQKYAIMAYNMGPTNLVRKIKSGENLPQGYYRKVMRHYQQILRISGRA